MPPKSHKVTVGFLKQAIKFSALVKKLEQRLSPEELDELGNYGMKFSTVDFQEPSKSAKLAVRDFKFEHLEESFGVRELGFGGLEWDLQEEFWCQSPELDSILRKFKEVVAESPQNEALIRGARLSTILLFTVAHMQFEYGISMTVQYRGKARRLRGSMDYALWCGNPYDADATFMVVEAKPRGNAGSGFTQLLVYMSMKRDVGKNATLYGAVTDSYVWHFVKISNDSTWSRATMTWAQHQGKIIAYLKLIMSHATSRGARAASEEWMDEDDEETDFYTL